MYKQIIITLYEKHYSYGVGALLNSITHSDFRGLIRIGYRGNLPFWINQLSKNGDVYRLTDNIYLSFVLLDNIAIHFGYYKPYFMVDTFAKYTDTESVFYFDPDIVVIAKWRLFTHWVESGIAICLDSNFPFVSPNHPWRKEWKLLGEQVPTKNSIFFYVNSGFIGIKRENMCLLDKWIYLTERLKATDGANLSKFFGVEESVPFFCFGDQELLNAAITLLPDLTYSVIGQEGMGFSLPATMMYHCVGKKPWTVCYVKNLLKSGMPPSISQKKYFYYSSSPVSLYPKWKLFFKKCDLKIASLLGRFYSGK